MSRYVTVRTQLRDMGLLRQTLQCMGLALQEGAGAWPLAGGRKADLVAQTPGGPVGFTQAEGEEITVVGMEEALRRGAGARFLRQVTQQYARRKVVSEAERAGYRLVEETVDADDTIRLVVRRW
ncbi:MAG: DUF1257 domain-containing protein [Armatimonadetes bacterium]|nr:DUF1257 domain-containing protein [Armatimonadota bacterium]